MEIEMNVMNGNIGQTFQNEKTSTNIHTTVVRKTTNVIKSENRPVYLSRSNDALKFSTVIMMAAKIDNFSIGSFPPKPYL